MVFLFAFAAMTSLFPSFSYAELEQGLKLEVATTKSQSTSLHSWRHFLADCAESGDADSIIRVSTLNAPLQKYCIDFNSINEESFAKKIQQINLLSASGLSIRFKVTSGDCAEAGLQSILETWPTL